MDSTSLPAEADSGQIGSVHMVWRPSGLGEQLRLAAEASKIMPREMKAVTERLAWECAIRHSANWVKIMYVDSTVHTITKHTYLCIG